MVFAIATQEDSATEPEVQLCKDDLHHLLSNSRRRLVLKHLYKAKGELEKGELIERVCEEEFNAPRDKIDRKERKRVYVSLSQTHLPKLEASHAIHMERDSIGLGTTAGQLLEYIDVQKSGLRSLLGP